MNITAQLSDTAILGELGRRVAAARIGRNLTQASLAEEAGVSKRTVERLESGEVAGRLSALVRVCRALGVADRLDALLPSPTIGPVEQLRTAGQGRKRASGRRTPASSTSKWTWGDES